MNQVEHFYPGGDRIAALRGQGAPGGPRRPEKWIASMTTMTSQTERGLSRLPDGTRLRDAVAADPVGWLGPEHAARFGASTELLVKLLDPGGRLPVHLHPDRAFARRHLGLPHGKTEAWIVLGVDPGARVRLGFAEPVRLPEVRALVDAGDAAGLLGLMRTLEVRPGDAVLVPAGVPHSIDAGVFLLELQEPSDLSILLEADGLDLDPHREGHLGLGFDVALTALRLDALGEDELGTLVVPGERLHASGQADLLPVAASPYFRAHRLRAGGAGSPDGPVIDPGFAVLLVVGGAGRLVPDAGEEVPLRRGDAVVVPYACGRWRLEGGEDTAGAAGGDVGVEAILCRPPSPVEGR
ncbi:mannose-6-phosphate isomerase [Thermopolyspora sp. NPDC052614]|uniref:class I mannose-6-phosphate isomerase n=1 Tax=Thermopolyspora sp. NPDC052614 TaxID=3155682 RepID=UPI00343C8D57